MPLSPRLDYRTCKRCGRHGNECGPLSHQRLCEDCALELAAANVEGIRLHSGPEFQRWRRAMAASVGGVLLDELEQGA